MSEMTARQSRRFFFILIFYTSDFIHLYCGNLPQLSLDISSRKPFYTINAGWFLKDNVLFRLLYHLEIYLLLLSIAGLVSSRP
jgi:hypothetical protein